MIFRRGFKPGLYSAIVTARSSEQPGRDHTYTVKVLADTGEAEFEGVSPQPELRWTTFDDTLEIVPFRLGTRVTVHVVTGADGLEAIIETGELPYAGPCSGATP